MEQRGEMRQISEDDYLSPFGVELVLPISNTVASNEGLTCLDTKPDGDTYPEEDIGPPAFPGYDCHNVASLN